MRAVTSPYTVEYGSHPRSAHGQARPERASFDCVDVVPFCPPFACMCEVIFMLASDLHFVVLVLRLEPVRVKSYIDQLFN